MPNFKYESEFTYDPTDVFGHMQEEFPTKSEFDVVIIGAGPNGLIAGAYLAKAGLSVAVVRAALRSAAAAWRPKRICTPATRPTRTSSTT